MATAVVFNAASPHEIAFTASGNGGDLAVAAATIYTSFSALGIHGGPLLALLRKTPDWTVFNLGNAQCDLVQVREIINRASGVAPTTFKFFWTAQGFNTDCAGTCQVEIRLQHSERF